MYSMTHCPQCGAVRTLTRAGSDNPRWVCPSCEAEQGLLKYKTLFELHLERGCSPRDANALVVLILLQDPLKTRLPYYLM